MVTIKMNPAPIMHKDGKKNKKKNQIMLSSIYVLTSLYVKERAC